MRRRDPSRWLRERNFSSGYWVFFSAACFYDAGFCIYFFLFNLYLLDCHWNERAMGWIGSALTLGTLVGTLPAGTLTRRFGLRPVLVMVFLTASAMNALRAVWMWEPAQLVLAFLAGLAMSAWGVCFLPAVARLTTEKNRAAGFSLIFSVSVATGIVGGVVCGYLGRWLQMAGIAMQGAEVKRLILLISCAIAAAGVFPVLRMREPAQAQVAETPPADWRSWLRAWRLHPFLLRFLPAMALWSAVLAAFTPFANVYLTRELHVSMAQIGLLFSAVQVLQLFMGVVTPAVFAALGLVNGIAATQMATAIILGLLAATHHAGFAIALYLIFSAAQWMSSPGLYNLVMNEVPDLDRSTAAAMTMFVNALSGAVATALAGALFTRFGYPPVLLGIATLAAGVALVFPLVIGRGEPRAPVQRPGVGWARESEREDQSRVLQGDEA